METDVFYNLKKTLIPMLRSNRPTLVIYDWHSTYVNILLPRENGIAILSCLPYQSLHTKEARKLKNPEESFFELVGNTWKQLG